TQFQVDDGQYVLGFDVSVEDGMLRVVERHEPPAVESEPDDDEDWFARGLELEETDPEGAIGAYERAAYVDPENIAAWTNWGRLLHEQGRTLDAERVYRRALDESGPDAVLLFNFGVLLEDIGRAGVALETYKLALVEDPNLADCHYNLARLYE